jgi:hypothetical protein
MFRSSRDGLISVTERPEQLDADGRAELRYVTGRESEETARGPERVGTIEVFADVARRQFDDLRDTILNLAFGALPKFVQPFVRSILGAPAQQLLSKITELTNSRSNTTLYVSYHDKPDDPTPTLEPEGTPQAISALFPLAVQSILIAEMELNATSCDGVDWDGTLRFSSVSDPNQTEGVFAIQIDGTLPVSWSFADGAPASTSVGPFTGNATTIYDYDVDYVVTFELSIDTVTDGDGVMTALTVDGVLNALSDDIPSTVPLADGFSGIGEPIAITDADAC